MIYGKIEVDFCVRGIYKRIKTVCKELFRKDSSGHDISHLERTMNTALYLQEKEGGDRIIIGISAFLHDVQGEFGAIPDPDLISALLK